MLATRTGRVAGCGARLVMSRAQATRGRTTMAKFRNFSAAQQVTLDTVYRACRRGLERLTNDVGSQNYRTHFALWMGGGSVATVKQAEDILNKELRNMFMRIATVSFSVEYNAAFGAHTNADMLSFSGASPDAVTNLVDEYRSGAGVADMMPMRLGDRFFAMPFKSLTEQSQVETFLHELSHHAAGTLDDTNGGECYGTVGVNRLKGLGPLRAVRNAENVGWFCTNWC
jgi:hypothetical protein